MSDQLFYVGAEDKNGNRTGFVPAKFLTVNGEPVVDPTPGGSQKAFVYYDASDDGKMAGRLANPNNYLIVPANYTEQHAREFAGQVALELNEGAPAPALLRAIAMMARAFPQGQPQDLQRHPQWGIPRDSTVPAFVGSASYHLGRVTRLSGLPLELSEVGGGIPNSINSRWQKFKEDVGLDHTKIDTSGPYGLSRQNYDNIEKGYADADKLGAVPSWADRSGYDPRSGANNGRIGNGEGIGPGDWRYSLAGVDPSNPTKPASPPLVGEGGASAQKPLRYLSGRAMPAPPVFETGSRPLRFVPFEYLLGLKPNLDFDERLPGKDALPRETVAPANSARHASTATAIQDYIRFLNGRDAMASSSSAFDMGAPAVPFVPTDELADPNRQDALFERSRTWIPRPPYR